MHGKVWDGWWMRQVQVRQMQMRERRNGVVWGRKGQDTDADTEGRDGERGVTCLDVDWGECSGCGTEHDAEGDKLERKGELNEGRVKTKLRQMEGEWKARGHEMEVVWFLESTSNEFIQV